MEILEIAKTPENNIYNKNLLKDPQSKISLFYPKLKIQKSFLDILKMSIFEKSMADVQKK
jgi:hypothetical protein